MSKLRIIIAGGPGSGKSTIAELIYKVLRESEQMVTVLSVDDYTKSSLDLNTRVAAVKMANIEIQIEEQQLTKHGTIHPFVGSPQNRCVLCCIKGGHLKECAARPPRRVEYI